MWKALKASDINNYKDTMKYSEKVDGIIKNYLESGVLQEKQLQQDDTINPINIVRGESSSPRIVIGLIVKNFLIVRD